MLPLSFDRLQSSHYWLKNAKVPVALLTDSSIEVEQSSEGLAGVDLEVREGRIGQVQPAGLSIASTTPEIDLKQGIVFPCFVDMHTHLDKGHIWQRSPNLDGSFDTALQQVQQDSEQHWTAEDVYRRMEFGLKCSYAHGTQAVRTHIDAMGKQAKISLGVFKTLQAEWLDRVAMQAVSLVPIEYFCTPAGEQLADLIAEVGGVLGGLVLMDDRLEAQLDRVFALAMERGLPLDFHTDESGNPGDITLLYVAEAAVRHEFSAQIVCGHCCSLATQPIEAVMKTLDWVKRANIGVVSLPMCNLYLQDRNQRASAAWGRQQDNPLAALGYPDLFPTVTPRWRGVTLLHELKHSGIPVAVASDNCRDPFFGFGDHDGLEVLTQATRIAHFDAPYGDWCRTVTMTPADLMGLPEMGRIGVGRSADLILFKARRFSELLSRPHLDRVVLRKGQPIDTTLPDYAELDDLL